MVVWRGLKSDFVLAFRRLRDAPLFVVISVATIALGVGANTAVFTLIDRVMLKPLPVPRPSELYRVGDTSDCCVNSGLAGSFSLFSYDLYVHLRDAAPQFSQLAAFQANTRAITIGRPDSDAPAETLDGAFVSGNYFQMLELAPAAGRLAQPADDRPGAPVVAVISHRAWTERFQRRTAVVGSGVVLNGVPATIIGVAPDGFFGETLRPGPAGLWVPLSAEPLLQPASRLLETKPSHWLYVMGRLKPGTAPGPIQEQLTSQLQHWIRSTLDLSREDAQQIPRQHVNIVPAAAGINRMRAQMAPSLRLLQAAAAAVLLIACANLANLLLARGLGRLTETALRVALGAPRSRLMAQSVTECLVLACAGGAAGLLVAIAAARGILALTFSGAANVPVDPSPSLLVLGFAFGVSLLTGVLFGVAPAVIGSRTDPIDALRGAARTSGDRGSRLRRSLIALQVAVSLVLITCAGLLGRSLSNLMQQDFGFRTESRYVASLAPSLATVPQQQLEALYARMRERLLTIPGVANVSFSLYSPMSGDNWSSLITVDGHSGTERLSASWNRVGPGYFETVGTPLLRGRAFDQRDRPGSPPVAVVSTTFARRFFGEVDPIGRRIGFAGGTSAAGPSIEVVGLVGDAKYQDGRKAPYATFFLPFLQTNAAAQPGAVPLRLDRSHYPQALQIQTASPFPALEGEVRRALAEVDQRVIVRTLVSLNEQVARQFNVERLTAHLTVAFGAVSLLLACLGLYGVTAYSVARRTREIGIRMAVGASRRRVLATVLRGAFVQLVIGVAIGLPGAFVAGRLLQTRLFGVSGHDPGVLLTALAVLALSSLVAALLPARRAATMNPVRALRME